LLGDQFRYLIPISIIFIATTIFLRRGFSASRGGTQPATFGRAAERRFRRRVQKTSAEVRCGSDSGPRAEIV
jgi:hypothetical protein